MDTIVACFSAPKEVLLATTSQTYSFSLPFVLLQAVADVPQVVTVLYNREAAGLSLSGLCERLFSLAVCTAVLLAASLDPSSAHYYADSRVHRVLLLSSAALLLQNFMLLVSISVFNPANSRWPKFSTLMLLLTVASVCVILYPVEIAKQVSFVIEWVAVACTLVAPVQTWYFNYKHRSTKRLSRTSQLFHAIAACVGVVLQLPLPYIGVSGATISWFPLIATAWNAFLRIQILLQIRASDEADALRNKDK